MSKYIVTGGAGFLGANLCRRLLADDHQVLCLDDFSTGKERNITELKDHNNFSFLNHDLTKSFFPEEADAIFNLASPASPVHYQFNPIRTLKMGTLAIYNVLGIATRLKIPVLQASTSEVYGMSPDKEFDPDNTNLVLGPINKPRWIYSCAKQMMDRVIHAYGQEYGLQYTLFRPFNWIGSGLDSFNSSKEGSSRVITQFFGNIARGEPIKLVDGGLQRRSFTDVSDGIEALIKIIENKNNIADGKIYNIGNPYNDLSIKELANKMIKMAINFPEYKTSALNVNLIEVTSKDYYGEGYQDMQKRVPFIKNTQEDLDWSPKVTFEESLTKIFEAYKANILSAIDELQQ